MGIFQWLFSNRRDAEREYRIFVSYSRCDSALVAPLVDFLRLSGIGVFRDVDHIPPGTRWKTVLSQAIDSCELFVLFWCEHSSASNEVQKEYDQAISAKKLVTPVQLDGTPLSAALSEFQAIDLRPFVQHATQEGSERRENLHDETDLFGNPVHREMKGSSYVHDGCGRSQYFDEDRNQVEKVQSKEPTTESYAMNAEQHLLTELTPRLERLFLNR